MTDSTNIYVTNNVIHLPHAVEISSKQVAVTTSHKA